MSIPTPKQLAEMKKPTIAEIATMTFPASRIVLERFYGRAEPRFERRAGDRQWRVRVDGGFWGHEREYLIWAWDKEEAEERAIALFSADPDVEMNDGDEECEGGSEDPWWEDDDCVNAEAEVVS